VQVVIGIDAGELTADHQAIAVTDEDRFDFGKIFGLHGYGNSKL
jgi:hypothetical protein